MGEETTTASAEGNASAQIYTRITTAPNETPFKIELTREEQDRHFYFNDDILEKAERIDRILNEMSNLQYESLPFIDQQIEQSQTNGTNSQTSILAMHRNGIVRQIANREDQIQDIERSILDELRIVRDEYRDLAEALNRRRLVYTQDYEANEADIQRRRRAAEEAINNALEWGGDTSGLVRPEDIGTDPNGAYSVHIESYERTYADYRFLEEGIAITTLREAFMNFVWGGVALVAMEIVTGGVAKFVIIGARGLTAIAGATRVGRVSARIAGQAAALIAARYNALSRAAKTRLDRLRTTRQLDEPVTPPRNGVADEAVDGPPATPRGACALC